MKEDSLVNSLLQVAKELDKREYIKKFKKDFENEISQSNNNNISKMDMDENEPLIKVVDNETLRMEVYEDKEYDVEEVKFWNFISKNKGIKPSVIRTAVYKCPESTYSFKKTTVTKPKKAKTLQQTPILIEKPKKEKIDDPPSPSLSNGTNKPKSQLDVSNVASKINKIPLKVPTSIETKAIDSVQPMLKLNSSANYKMEDLILIDEDDDIIDFNDDEEETQANENNIEKDNEMISSVQSEQNQVQEEEEKDEISSEQENSVSGSEHNSIKQEQQQTTILKSKVVIEKVEDEPRKKKINLKQKQPKKSENLQVFADSAEETNTTKSTKSNKLNSKVKNEKLQSNSNENNNRNINKSEYNRRVTRSNSRLGNL